MISHIFELIKKILLIVGDKVNTVFDKQKIAKWQRWQEQIENDVVYLLASRKIYKSYGEIVNNNSSVQSDGALFHGWIKDNYVTFVAMSIRRQLDVDKDVISLSRLLADIVSNPESLSRKWHDSLYSGFVVSGFGDQMFNESAGTGDYIDLAIVEKDLSELKTAGENIKSLADRSIAHKTVKKKPQLTFDDVDKCIETIKVITAKYRLLLTAKGGELEPTMADWQNIFTQRWISRDLND